MFRRKFASAYVVVAWFLSGVGFVAEAQPELEELMVVGARAASDEIAAATVIDRETIEARNGASTVDLFRQAPGVTVIQPGGAGGVSELFVRGSESNFTVVTIDGVRVNDITNSRGGGFDFAVLGPDDIERIEVMRGSLSSLYGSDALAGAVNIVTRRPRTERIILRGEVGNDGYGRGYASFGSGAEPPFNVGLSVSHLDSGEPVAGSTRRSSALRASLSWADSDRRDVVVQLGHGEHERTSYPTGGGGPLHAVLPDLERSEAADTTLRLGWSESLSEHAELNVSLSHFNNNETFATPQIPSGVFQGTPAMTGESEMSRSHLVIHGIWRGIENMTLIAGAEHQRESGNSDALFDFGGPVPSNFDLRRRSAAAFVEGNYQGPWGVGLFATVRADRSAGHGTNTSAKLAIWRGWASGTRVGASWGEAFKLPSFYALGDSLTGDPNLRAEVGDSLEFYVRQEFAEGAARFTGSLFRSRYDGLIDFDFETFRLINRADVKVEGLELEATVRLGEGVTLGAHASRLRYHSPGGALNGRARSMGNVFVRWHSGDRWRLAAELWHSGRRPSASTPTGPAVLEAYQRVDLAVQRKLPHRLFLSINVDNLSSTFIQHEMGFPAPKRSVRLGLAAQLRE